MIISQDLVEMHEWEKRSFLPPIPGLIRRTAAPSLAVADSLWFEVSGAKSDLADVAGGIFPAVMAIIRGADQAPVIAGNQIFHFGEEVEPVLARLLRSITGNVTFYLGRDGAGSDEATLAIAGMVMQPNPRLQKRALIVEPLQPPLTDALVDAARANGWTWRIEHGMFVATHG